MADPPIDTDRLGRPIVGPCWLWQGATQFGYGAARPDGKSNNRKVHVMMYELLRGPVDQQLDHLCRVRHCCNPDHLEDVSPGENTRRRDNYESTVTHCPAGHEYTEANTNSNNGYRRCRACDRAAKRAKRGTPADAVFGKDRTHCKNGHEWTEENTYLPPRNPDNRICRICTRKSQALYRARKVQVTIN